MTSKFKKFSIPLTALVTVLALILVAGCGSIYHEEMRPTRTYSKNFFVHVVRYNGETLSLISLWYTGSEKNATEIRRQNRYISTVSEELVVNSRIMIPRRMLQTMKLMPVGFVRKNSAELGYEEDTPTPEPTATSTPTDTPTPVPSATPTETPEPLPTAIPERRPTAPIISRPRAERNDFSDEDPAESPNSQIQIPQDIVEDLKSMGNGPKPQPPAQRIEPIEPRQEFIPPPTFDEEATAIPAPPPARQRYTDPLPRPEVSAEPEPEISDDRKKLLEILRGNRNR